MYAGLLHGHFGRWADPFARPAFTAWLIGVHDSVPRLFTYFIAGMCFYAYRCWVPYTIPLLVAAVTALCASALVSGALPLTLPVLGPYVLLWFAFMPCHRLSRIGTRNDLSYGIYLYAFPIQQLLTLYLGPHLVPVTAFLAAMPSTMLFAWLSWKVVEKPAQPLRGRQNLSRRQSGRLAPPGSRLARSLGRGKRDHKGRTYRIILVNRESGRIVDLLPDRSALGVG